MKYLFFAFILVSFATNCEKEAVITIDPGQTKFKYLFTGHTYEGKNTIDNRLLAHLDKDKYDHFWLGGDMCSETTRDSLTLEYMDFLFDLSSPTTHWALGNHDIRNGNLQWITNKTERHTFYTNTFNGICLMVLNTNYARKEVNDTAQVNAQYEMIKNVCDTLQNVSHLVLLSHHMSWQKVPGIDGAVLNANLNSYNLDWKFDPNENFVNGVYPLLKEVKNRGINVVNLSGDFGQKQTEYYEESDDGIHFFGSGITAETTWNEQFPSFGKPDKILIFEHDTETQELTWHFDVL